MTLGLYQQSCVHCNKRTTEVHSDICTASPDGGHRWTIILSAEE